MIDLSPEVALLVMFGGLIVLVLIGMPLAFVLGWMALVVGYMTIGSSIFGILYSRIMAVATNYTFIAGPMFVFMGMVLYHAGIAEKLFEAMYVLMGRVRGGLAIGTVIIGVALAVCVGVIAASVIAIGLIALPSMLTRGYDKGLACGTVCASGTLGILIPPSVMIVFYGPAANLSVGKLFMGAFVPGLILALMYMAYVALRCLVRPMDGPPISDLEKIPWRRKLYLLITAFLPPLFIMFSVLGTIFFGIASPTESAAMGAVAAVILAAVRRRLSLSVLKESTYGAARLIAMALLIAITAGMFAAVFILLGCGDVLARLILSAPGGKWGVFAVIMLITLVLGMFVDWVGIIFVLVPIVTPITVAAGFDPVWFAIIVMVNLQASFLTPPFAYSIFFVKGMCLPEWGVETKDIIDGVIPFVLIIVVAIVLFAAFPQTVTWLPSAMIK